MGVHRSIPWGNARFVAVGTCLLLLISSLSCLGATRALVVGIDEYPGDNRLSSCVNDARGIQDLLTKQFAAEPNAVRLLLNSDATASGIRKAFKQHLLETAGPGDEVLFFFSGHGSILDNWSGTGRLMKVLVPQDVPTSLAKIDESNVISHAELKGWLAQIRSTNITVILDCCHAGSMSKGFGQSGPEVKTMNLGFGPAEHFLQDERGENSRIYSKAANALISVLWLGGCQSNQVSYCGTPTSQFTGSLLSRLKKSPGQRISEVFPGLQREVEANTSGNREGVQSPALEGPADRPLVRKLARAGGTDVAQTVVTGSAQTPARPASLPNLNPFSDTPQPFELMVQTDAPAYFAGDTMRLKVVAGMDCYLRLYVVNAGLETQQIFPNQYTVSNFVRKGEILEIPAPDTFVLRMGEPFGTETIVAVGSPTQFSDLYQPDFSQSGFMDLGDMSPAETGRRGITVEAARPAGGVASANRVSIARVRYSVSPKDKGPRVQGETR